MNDILDPEEGHPIRIVTPDESFVLLIFNDKQLIDFVEDLTNDYTKIWIVYKPEDDEVVELWAMIKPPLEYLEQRKGHADLMARPDDN